MTNATALFTPTRPPGLIAPALPAAPSLGSAGGNGAISGGLLRPGSIDQATFVQMLQQQQQNRQAAGVGGKPVSMPVQSLQNGIPNLSSAQFAALVGATGAKDLAAEPAEAPPADPQAIAAQQVQQAARTATPLAPALKLSGAAARNANAAAAGEPSTKPASAETGADEPTISRAAAPQPAVDDEAQITRHSEQTATAPDAASGSGEKKPGDSETASKGDPDVVHLKSPPDKDQVKELRMRHKRWVVDETPGARQLFFGADGKFGWDDFLDMINPLQHIPGIAQIYRAVTGDEISGAANLLGAIPFGPLGGVGLISTVADLAVKDVTGHDIGDNLTAMVFGRDGTPKDGAAVPADMAQAGESETTTVQTASRESRYGLSEASTLHESCRA